ncbi:hypothetical protein JHN55_06975 [Streptomyces sp. MBT56]|uniref:hypothetical protein n=1 Tax=unclassified Streptomyces TaxID=2593676 RepID=UPI0019094692|nr:MULTISPECIES: hypothetical protein [unclassified Streptomyces]MBK3556281.1 hypothetical protein [Streptomyces sp. MBT56]MBK3601253.1 hypothetical protein [Streptomyces sp. MBT54]MBK3614512.1 hypothetical protein [Streptomyces sp. MBT98]MBK6042843.1 hypothetical protein [Streptomyces sp. MBT55]
MSDHDDEMTNADVMSGEEMREYDQAAEALLDAQDEERWAAEDAAAETRAAASDDEEPFEGLADGEER